MKAIICSLFVLWLITTIYFFYVLHTDEEHKVKVILLGNSFWGDWEVGVGKETFFRLNCPVSNCEITQDKSRSVDAVLFHAHDLDEHPPRLGHRPHHQRWVFFMLESPGWSVNRNYMKWKGLFNWTMTYRTDSDVRLFYGQVKPREDTGKQRSGWSALVKKRRPVAWVVSNCRTQSRREEYVKRLQKWIDVDVYGRCGNFTCTKDWQNADGDCLRMIGDKYNFYLAFENSFCKDYVTEKFFKMLHLDTIPIVRGGASYEKHSPRRWYINTKDFKSPRKLALHLKRLISRPKLYAQFMKDKERFHSEAFFGIRHLPSWCNLCKKLNDPSEPTKIYQEMGKWWNGKDCHQPKDIW
ncbi:hypothetical protein CAPTEDRAFT_110767 [Capitella teleta]|uniref:Fucosyltransferase n=1 Tax=Capitella teleta TaxID=283909 RepID=R7UPU0_CAPTE|nr:hypothetical protein CAPTEDRAFT_110767 [Capitella teleta]|eukprot:ELU08205.1 hypothetical protein CAPTEDRAFT_110767 [Capitella teleta]